jgi:hypothetical protein
MKSIKILVIVVGLIASSATLAATKTVYVPEPVIFINANHISSIYVGSNTYYDEKNSGLMPKYIQKPALIYIVGKSTHALDFDEPAKEQSRILELIQKTCK